MYSKIDAAWIAGLLEGEGWFFAAGHLRRCPSLSLSMTDRDVVSRAARIFQRPMVGPYRNNGFSSKRQMWRVNLSGDDAVIWMQRILPHMGRRRSTRIRDVLRRWNAPRRRVVFRVRCGHVRRKHLARGYCASCYQMTIERRHARGLRGVPMLRGARVLRWVPGGSRHEQR